MKKYVLFLFFIYSNVLAKDLGTFGELFPITENNLIDVIKNQLAEMEKNGNLELFNREMQQKARDRLNRPKTVLTNKVEKTTEKLFDPSVTLNRDLKDDKGQIFAKKGTRVNPLNWVNFEMKLYFLDADDDLQVKWLSKQNLKSQDKIILTNGSPFELEKILKKRVFYDQNGELIERLKIKSVPVVVERDGYLLKITEVSVNE